MKSCTYYETAQAQSNSSRSFLIPLALKLHQIGSLLIKLGQFWKKAQFRNPDLRTFVRICVLLRDICALFAGWFCPIFFDFGRFWTPRSTKHHQTDMFWGVKVELT